MDRVSCLCLDVTKTYKVTVDGESITGSFEEIVSFLDKHGLYAYPSVSECNPSYEGSSDITEEVPTVTVEVELNDVSDNPDEINILTLLGVTEDIDMQTCFRSGGEG